MRLRQIQHTCTNVPARWTDQKQITPYIYCIELSANWYEGLKVDINNVQFQGKTSRVTQTIYTTYKCTGTSLTNIYVYNLFIKLHPSAFQGMLTFYQWLFMTQTIQWPPFQDYQPRNKYGKLKYM